MFIRYNQLAKYWEYDGSGGANAGPWIKLEIDYSQIINVPFLPANIAFKDQANVFTATQTVATANSAEVDLLETIGGVNFRLINYQNRMQVYYNPVGGLHQVDLAGNTFILGHYFEAGRTTASGLWQNVPFNAGNFLASSGTWAVAAGHVLVNRYTIIGRTMIWSIRVSGSSLSGALNQFLHIILPSGVTSGQYYGSTRAVESIDASGNAPTRIWTYGSTLPTYIVIEKEAGTFVPGTYNLSFTLTFELL